MDIQIKNEAAAINVCETAKNQYIRQLNGHIGILEYNISKINSLWASSGVDKESYMKELQKQLNNLKTISDQSFKFFNVIQNYIEGTQSIASSSVAGGAMSSAVRNVVTTAKNAIDKVVKSQGLQTANRINGISDNLNSMASSGGSLSSGKTSSVGSNVSSGNSSAGGNTTSKGSSSTSSISSSSSGKNNTISNINSNLSNGTNGVNGLVSNSGYKNNYSSSNDIVGGIRDTVGSVPSTSTSSLSSGASSLLGSGSSITPTGGKSASVGSYNPSSELSSLVSKQATSAATSTKGNMTSKVLTSNKATGIIPKLLVPNDSGSLKTTNKVVPVISGSMAAGAVGLGSAMYLKKKKQKENDDSVNGLQIDAQEFSEDNEEEFKIFNIEEKLNNLTSDE